ncbi:MAG: DNA-directed DNA polymerase II small subunit, partial [Thermoplasmata archaeon]|nr:DNA-directed DNA polymerase II small subunit [Thermoplasmata archaeon]
VKDVTGRTSSSASVDKFKSCFRDRYRKLRGLIRKREGFGAPMDICSVASSSGDFRIVGMVREVSTTRRGKRVLELDDETGVVSVVVPQDVLPPDEVVLPDEVVGVAGRRGGGRGSLFADEVVFPSIPRTRRVNTAGEEVYAAFISDIHVGSNTFLPRVWERFLRFLRDGGGRKGGLRVVERLKYIVAVGDLVDGIGIYPGQEEELVIDEIERQYRELARILSPIPDHVELVLLPGNHDAVRPAEPQPAFSRAVQEIFLEEGVAPRFVGNPCFMRLEGVSVLAYHGRSMDDFLSMVPGFSYERPLDAMKLMLEKRHLAPVYGGRTPLAPEPEDFLVIEEVPDIFVTGHVHSVGVETYKGVLLINSSTWQAQTEFQKRHNFNPIPGKVPVVNLGSLEYRVLDFEKG